MSFQNLARFETYFWSSIVLLQRLLWSTVTTLVRCIFPETQFNISVLSTLKWIYISCMKKQGLCPWDPPPPHTHTQGTSRAWVARGQIRVLYVLSRYLIADIFIKGLPLQPFDDFRDR